MSFLLALGFALLGLVTGVLSGCFGIGGGVLIAPALVLLFGFSQKLATGTSLALLLPPLGLFAVIEYYKANNVNLAAAFVIAVCMMLGMWLGAKAALRVDETKLKLSFGLLMIAIGLLIAWNALATKTPNQPPV